MDMGANIMKTICEEYTPSPAEPPAYPPHTAQRMATDHSSFATGSPPQTPASKSSLSLSSEITTDLYAQHHLSTSTIVQPIIYKS